MGHSFWLNRSNWRKLLKSTRERRPCRPITFSLVSIFQEKEKQRQTASKNNKEPWCSKLTTSLPPTWQKNNNNNLCCEDILAMGETSTNHQLNTGIEKRFQTYAEASWYQWTVAQCPVSDPKHSNMWKKNSRISNEPKKMSNRQGSTISQFQNNYSHFLSSMEPVFNQSCRYCPVLRPPSARSLKFEKEY